MCVCVYIYVCVCVCVYVCVCVCVKITDWPRAPKPNLAGHMQPTEHELDIFSVN